MNFRSYLFFFAAAAIVVLSIALISALAITATVTPSNVKEDISYRYNFTIANLNITANVSQVNITAPAGFTITPSTNGTSANGVLTINSTTSYLSWLNATNQLIINGTTQYFWFNATASTPGTYNFTVKVLDEAGVLNTTYVQVIVNDTTNPVVNLQTPTNQTNSSVRNVVFNCTATDNTALSNITLYVWNSTADIVNQTVTAVSGVSNESVVNVTLPSDGAFTWNCKAIDTVSNSAFNDTNWTVTVDTSVPVSGGHHHGSTTTTTTNTTTCTEHWSCSGWSNCVNGVQTQVCIDSNDCRTTANKPATFKACISTPASASAPQRSSVSPAAPPVTGAAVQPTTSPWASRIKALEISAAVIVFFAGLTVSIYFIARKK
jgi:hypothetical protein